MKNYEIDDNNYKMDGVKGIEGDPDFTCYFLHKNHVPYLRHPLSVKLKCEKTSVIDEVNEDGSDIKKVMDKTFGIKYILGGGMKPFILMEMKKIGENIN